MLTKIVGIVCFADRWDAKGQLWKVLWSLPVVMPDVPAVNYIIFGFYDLNSGDWFTETVNEESIQYMVPAQHYPDRMYSGDALAAESVR